jgi:hypothetical protein
MALYAKSFLVAAAVVAGADGASLPPRWTDGKPIRVRIRIEIANAARH